ncbi:putative serine/threonine protein kinase [Blattamonas nauphoetae]|uniref:Serine/threonine protein kinase n=1 Tax=Blattamonas nauphoetae TaxID=2049346 RepID=A0ABQ9XB90_9EUKA|nr:putative serine/threonine protein kinase [Blattamonas nauphoetae]
MDATLFDTDDKTQQEFERQISLYEQLIRDHDSFKLSLSLTSHDWISLTEYAETLNHTSLNYSNNYLDSLSSSQKLHLINACLHSTNSHQSNFKTAFADVLSLLSCDSDPIVKIAANIYQTITTSGTLNLSCLGSFFSNLFSRVAHISHQQRSINHNDTVSSHFSPNPQDFPSTDELHFVIQENIFFPPYLDKDVSYIASGQNGSVFKAFSPSLGELAVKLVPEDKFKQKELDAARNLDQIRCEFFTRYLLITQNRPYIIFVMEYANSGTLANLIQEGTVLPEDRIREIFQQIFTGVGAMHEVGVIHRDLKPENVMLHRPQPDAPQVVKITDFGFSRVVENDGTAITRCCTPKYAAPELLFSNLPYSQKADIWSIGVMMFKSASGQYANSSDSILQTPVRWKIHPRSLHRD